MSYFPAICGLFCNMARPLRDEDFTMELTEGEKFRQTYTYLVLEYINPFMIKLRLKSVDLFQKSFFGRQNCLSTYSSFLRAAMFAPWQSQRSLRKRKDPITGNSLIAQWNLRSLTFAFSKLLAVMVDNNSARFVVSPILLTCILSSEEKKI